MDKYDLIVIGGGSAGYAAAMRGIDYGKKVCLIEKDRVGGAGVYNGALSSKTLWELSSRVASVNQTMGSADRENYDIPWLDVKRNLEEAIFERKFQYSCHIKLLQTETLNKHFHYERGFGQFETKNEIKIFHDGSSKVIHGENIIIATGSRPRQLPNIPVDEKTILTSDGIDQISGLPRKHGDCWGRCNWL